MLAFFCLVELVILVIPTRFMFHQSAPHRKKKLVYRSIAGFPHSALTPSQLKIIKPVRGISLLYVIRKNCQTFCGKERAKGDLAYSQVGGSGRFAGTD